MCPGREITALVWGLGVCSSRWAKPAQNSAESFTIYIYNLSSLAKIVNVRKVALFSEGLHAPHSPDLSQSRNSEAGPAPGNGFPLWPVTAFFSLDDKVKKIKWKRDHHARRFRGALKLIASGKHQRKLGNLACRSGFVSSTQLPSSASISMQLLFFLIWLSD